MSKFEDGSYASLAGVSLIGKVLAGRCSMKYTRASAGSGQIPEGMTPKTMTGSAGYVMDAAISSVTNPVDGECQVTVQIKSDDVDTGFYLTNIVLFAEDPDEGEVPFTYLSLENEPEWIRPASSIVGKFATFDVIAAVGDVDAVTAIIDPEAIASVSQVVSLVAEHNADINAHQSKEQLNNLLVEPLFDAHSHRGALGIIASIYPDDTGLIDICTFWKAKISADESLWSARVYDCTYDGRTVKALFINHPDMPTSARLWWVRFWLS